MVRGAANGNPSRPAYLPLWSICGAGTAHEAAMKLAGRPPPNELAALAAQQFRDDLVPLVLGRTFRKRLVGAAIPVSGVTDLATIKSMQIGVYPGGLRPHQRLHDDVRLIPVTLGSPPQRRKLWRNTPRRGRTRQAGFKSIWSHHHTSGLKRPVACSIIAPSESSVSSSNGRPISCSPSGSP